MSKTLPVVEVEWLDSVGHHGWQPTEQAHAQVGEETMRQRSAGYLLQKSSRCIVLALSASETTNTVGDLLQIPRSSVVSVTVLRKTAKK